MTGRLTVGAVLLVSVFAGGCAGAPQVPDFSGIWGGGGFGFSLVEDESGNLALGLERIFREGSLSNFERDSGLNQRSNPNRPMYKPEYWPLVQYYDLNGNLEDPEFKCFPAGVPRMGPPTQIVQTPEMMIFLYQTRNERRIIYTDGRPHPPEEEWGGRWYGHSIGRWEGDTLVIDTVDFTDESWLGWPGWAHTYNMHVEERMRREGDTMHWQATVTDPDALLRPWVMDEETRQLNADPMAEIGEDLPCLEQDAAHIVTKERG